MMGWLVSAPLWLAIAIGVIRGVRAQDEPLYPEDERG